MSDLRVRELERRALAGDPTAVTQLRSWEARHGNCDHDFYVDSVELAPVEEKNGKKIFNHGFRYRAFIRCEFCSIKRPVITPYNPLNELHRLSITLTEKDELVLAIDDSITTCFRLGFVRLGFDKWDPLGKSLVTNNDEWMHVARVLIEKDREAGLAVHTTARGFGELRVLRGGDQAALVTFEPPVRRSDWRGTRLGPLSISKAAFLPGPFKENDVMDIEIRYTGPEGAMP